MMLSNDFHSEMILLHFDVRIALYGCDKSALNLSTGVISMMKYAEFRVSSLAMEVKLLSLIHI